MAHIVLENESFRLLIDEKCRATSLTLKPTGEELLYTEEPTPLFSVTQERPYNNEIKLIYMNKKTTFPADRVRREDGKLIVGFEITPFEAVVKVKITPRYVTFTLEEFIVHPTDYEGLRMDTPPVLSFRLCALPVKPKENFGSWLNAMWDEKTAVCVLATSPHAEIDSEECRDHRILTADAHRDILLKGCEIAIVAAAGGEALLDVIDEIEEDYDLPRGVKSRREADLLNSSIYWASYVNPETVDRHIAYAKRAGFRLMLINFMGLFFEDYGWSRNGDYDLKEPFAGDSENLRAMLDKIKAAGITPGFHFLHTHIGVRSRYVTPVADHRLHLKRHLTLAAPLGTDDTTITVAQNPQGCPLDFPSCRILQFGGEIISYEGYTTEPPYTFTGCVRGHFGTNIVPHDKGQIGGVLDASEYGTTTLYLDQETDLMDEIAEKLGRVWALGFEFAYFDGSEGTNAPFAFHIANAQYRVYKKFSPAPIFCEGAAKTHFSWHMLSGANAFDIFPTNVFKKMLDRHPVHEAPLMKQNFTRLNFGWWGLSKDTRPDVYEYGMSRAAAWDCAATMSTYSFAPFDENPRTDDVLEVLRRWEDARHSGFLTEERKKLLRTTDEYILLVNEEGEYEMVPYTQIEGTPEGLYAFTFTRGDRNYAVYWQQGADQTFSLPLTGLLCEEELGGERTPVKEEKGATVLPASRRRYLSTKESVNVLAEAFRNAEFL